jgi:hypothetical protein
MSEAPRLTEEEITMLSKPRLIAEAKEMVRKAEEAQRRVDARQGQKLLVAQNG